MKKTLLTLSVSAVLTATITTGASAGPNGFIGDIQPYPYTFCPRGTLEANGATLSISSNQNLFSLLGTMYGGDGRTTFMLPDLRGRAANHFVANSSPQGNRGGAETRTITTQNLPSHTHAIPVASAGTQASPVGALPSVLPNNVNAFSTEVVPSGDHMAANMIQNSGASQPVPVMAPSLAMKWCVTTLGLYPSRN